MGFSRFIRFAATATVAAFVVSLDAASHPTNPQAQQPVFRAGANFVLVDAYPQRDGKIVEGLTAADFQVLEDGKPQTIESLEFVRVEPAQVESARRDPNSLNEMKAQAADPHNRVFVVFLDTAHTTIAGSHTIRRPLVDTLNRIVGPDDLFGVTTQNLRPQDLTLGRRRDTVEEQLSKHWTWGERQRVGTDPNDPAEGDLESCFHMRWDGERWLPWLVADGPVMRYFDEILIDRRREDRMLTALDDLSRYVGEIREARTVLMIVTNGWVLYRADDGLRNELGRDPRFKLMPRIGEDPIGTRVPVAAPPAGKGRLSIGEANPASCGAEATRLLLLDDDRRFRDLIALANRSNVSVYPVAANGLAVTDGFGAETRVIPNEKNTTGDNVISQSMRRLGDRINSLRTIAENTDGIAIVNTNDLAGGLRRIVDDVSAYYLLGYYSTNTKFDGRFRKIEVKVKTPGLAIHARRGYLAPSEARASAASPGPSSSGPAAVPVDDALAALGRVREAAEAFVAGSVSATEIAAVVEIASRYAASGAWAQGGDVRIEVADAAGQRIGEGTAKIEPGARGALVRIPRSGTGPWRISARIKGAGTPAESLDERGEIQPSTSTLVGDPLMFRATPSPRSPLRPVADLMFRRTERVHVEWPVLKPLDQRIARLLDRRGQPLPIPVTVTEREVDGRAVVAVDVQLTPLSEGDYVIELTAGSGASSERRLVAIRVVR